MQSFININKITITFKERNQIIILEVQNYYNISTYLYIYAKEILYFVYKKSVILDVILINLLIKIFINKYIFSIYCVNT